MNSQLIGQIKTIIYEGDDGFFIALLSDGTKVRGSYFESDVSHLKGAAVRLEGNYEEHKKYGKTFVIENLHVNQNQLFFFLNRVIKGFTKKLSAELIEKFGEEGLVNILDNDIEKLLEFKGIKEKRLKKIQTSWKQYKSMRELGEFLSPFGVTTTLLTTIATAMKDVTEPITKIKNNPYILTSINGIGFKRADEIALKMGVEPRSEKRLASAMDYLLFELCEQQGNSAVVKELLFFKLDEILNFHNENSLYEQVLLDLVNDETVMMMQHHRLSPRRLYEAESLLFTEFKRRAKIKEQTIVENLDEFMTDGLKLGAQQKEAVALINSGIHLLFLVGYAGTGKSTTAKTILDLLAQKYNASSIMTTALSGIASQRIGERTGYESATIQSLLVKYDERDYFGFDVLLIDEASMINSSLFARLIAKIGRDAVLIIVGDDAQLPPIGAGNVLSDVLTRELAPIVKLTQIYRQNEEQAIALIANDIRQGVIPQYRAFYEDFEFMDVSIANYYAMKSALSQDEFSHIRDENSQAILSRLVTKSMEYIPSARKYLQNKEIGNYLNCFQVISPIKGGVLGVDNLNKVLQDYFNPKASAIVKRGEREYRVMDKVVHTKNENMPSFTTDAYKEGMQSADRRVFNGMSGLLFKIDSDEELAFVIYPNEDLVVQYDFTQLTSHLMLSYALTIHKVQGMEYDVVVMPMTFSHYIMHNTKLLYTAITRAKKECIIVGEGGAFESACRRFEVTRRDTVMLELL
ncbi:MAG: AAA family ATPase [Campylobacterota bacterium]|nr:AAA family ATPase [Campylobacterota bacterium]